MEKLILVIYLDVVNLEPVNAREILANMHHTVSRTLEGENIIHFVIPAKENKVECINPKLVTEEEYAKAKEILEKVNKLS